MNKKITLISALVILFFTSNAQFHAGILGGLNLSKISNEEKQDGEVMHIGGHISVPFNIGLFESDPIKYSIQTEINLTMQGSASSENTISYTFNVHYVKIPVMLKVHFGDDSFRPFVNVGPYLGYHAMYYSSVKIGNEISYSDAEEPDSEFMNTMDFGLNLGAGFNAKAFIFEVRYSLGFSDIIKDFKSKNRVLSLSIGYLMFE